VGKRLLAIDFLFNLLQQIRDRIRLFRQGSARPLRLRSLQRFKYIAHVEETLPTAAGPSSVLAAGGHALQAASSPPAGVPSAPVLPTAGHRHYFSVPRTAHRAANPAPRRQRSQV